MKKKFMPWFIVFLVILFIGCGGDGGNDGDEGNNTTTIEGTISANSLFRANPVTDKVLYLNVSNGNVIVMAVDNEANIYTDATDAVGKFSIEVPLGNSYVLMFMNSTGQFVGILVFNNEAKALKAEAEKIDLGTVTISGGTAISSNENNLAAITEETLIEKPEDITYGENTKYISFSLYNQFKEGDIVVSKGSGDENLDIEDDWRLTRYTYEYDEEIGKWVYIEWVYDFDDDQDGIPISAYIKDKRFWYLSATGRNQYKIERSATVTEEGDGEVPDLVEVGKTYTISDVTYKVLNTFSDKIFPNVDNSPREGYVIDLWEGDEHRFCWYVKGIGETLFTKNLTTDDDNNIYMKVIYKKSGNTEYGTRPNWLTNDFIQNLPDDWD